MLYSVWPIFYVFVEIMNIGCRGHGDDRRRAFLKLGFLIIFLIYIIYHSTLILYSLFIYYIISIQYSLLIIHNPILLLIFPISYYIYLIIIILIYNHNHYNLNDMINDIYEKTKKKWTFLKKCKKRFTFFEK